MRKPGLKLPLLNNFRPEIVDIFSAQRTNTIRQGGGAQTNTIQQSGGAQANTIQKNGGAQANTIQQNGGAQSNTNYKSGGAQTNTIHQIGGAQRQQTNTMQQHGGVKIYQNLPQMKSPKPKRNQARLCFSTHSQFQNTILKDKEKNIFANRLKVLGMVALIQVLQEIFH